MFLNRNVTVLFSNSTPDINDKIFFPRCISMHTDTKDEAEMQALTGLCTSHTSAAKAGFIPRLLESDISMALSGVSMAIPCTEMKRGTLALGLARNRDKFTSQLERLKPLPLLYRSCFSITVHASQHYPLLHTPSQKKHFHHHHHHFVLLPHTALAHCHTQRVFLGAKLLCSLL